MSRDRTRRLMDAARMKRGMQDQARKTALATYYASRGLTEVMIPPRVGIPRDKSGRPITLPKLKFMGEL